MRRGEEIVDFKGTFQELTEKHPDLGLRHR
jgi:hypothetical protein